MNRFFVSLRFSILAWIILVVFAALASMIYFTDSMRRADVHDLANEAVEKTAVEVEAHSRLPGGHSSSAELIETYLSHEVPEANEVLVGVIDDRLVFQQLDSLTRPDVDARAFSPMVRSIIANEPASGITDGVHWGKITVPSAEGLDYVVVLVSTEQVYADLNRQTLIFAGLGLISLSMAAAIAWVISSRIIAPVRQVAQVAERISQSNLTTRVPVHGDDEVAQLARTFNHMMDRIDEAYRAQRQFIDDAGHELRTPITILRGNLELLDTATPAERERSLELCISELDRMTRMVNDLLTLAIAESADSDFLNIEQVDLSQLTIDIDDKAHVLTNGRSEVVGIGEGQILCDPARITEAVLEFVRNAAKYSPPDSPIHIASNLDNGTARFTVTDFGAGIEPAQQETLFQRFHRGSLDNRENPARTSSKGAGLGLSIVQAIAQAHGGHAFVNSPETNTQTPQGATFGIEIPIESTMTR